MNIIRRITILSFCTFILLGCGSIASVFQKERTVHLMQSPQNLEVKVNGESKRITSEAFAVNSFMSDYTTTYYTAGVKLPYKKAATMELTSGDKKAVIDLTPKRWSVIFWGNMFSFPITGHIFDGITDNNKVLKPNFIDVEYALEGKPVSEWRGKSKLKSMEKKGIRKGN